MVGKEDYQLEIKSIFMQEPKPNELTLQGIIWNAVVKLDKKNLPTCLSSGRLSLVRASGKRQR
ncbi:MAG: hypothetical protein MUO34_08825 [Ignavibacteriaceae bacterium]|nr:hypothetical protein [Ignavibacteriaceae bacterium]